MYEGFMTIDESGDNAVTHDVIIADQQRGDENAPPRNDDDDDSVC